MNIWLVNQYAVPPSQAGITRHHMLARELERRNHRVVVIACSFDHLTRTQTKTSSDLLFKSEIVDNVQFLWIHSNAYNGNTFARARNMAGFAWQLWRETGLRTVCQPDVILGSSPTVFAALSAQQLAHRRGIPFVLEVRDLWPLSLIHLGKVSPSHPAVGILEKIESHLYRSSDQIITLLPGSFDHLVRKGAHPDSIHWIPNGVDLSGISPRPQLPGDKLVVLFAGTHGLAGSLETLVDAAEILQNNPAACHIEMRFVGDGPNKEALMRRANQKQLWNVNFLPPVVKKNMNACLAGADILVAVLRRNGLYNHGISLNKLYDYMAAGRPVIFGGKGAVGNPIEASGCGLSVPPEDPAALAEAILQIASMSAANRHALGMRGRKYVETFHNISNLAGKLEDVLQLSRGSSLRIAA